MSESEKSKTELSETMTAIKKRYGQTTIRLGTQVYQPDRISTGAFTLDFALLGGIPHSRVTMVVGERHAGKSMLANLIIANAQRMFPDQTPVLLDIEGTFESTWAERLGVDISQLPVVACESGEMAVDVGDAIIQSAETSLLVVDSLAAVTPLKEAESSAEDAMVGSQARLLGSFIRRLTSSLTKERNRGHSVTVLFLNQFRMKIGVSYGDPRVIPGGKALEFCTTVQIIIKNKENKGTTPEGVDTMTTNEHAFTITKNKLNNGPRTGEFVLVRAADEENGLMVGDIDDAPTVLSFAKKFGLYGGGGSKWTLEFADTKLNFGKAKDAIQMLREDREVYHDLRTHILRMQAGRLGMTDEFIARIR